MASTGEVTSFGADIQEAYWASLPSTTGFEVPRANSGVLIGGDTSKPEMAFIAKTLVDLSSVHAVIFMHDSTVTLVN